MNLSYLKLQLVQQLESERFALFVVRNIPCYNRIYSLVNVGWFNDNHPLKEQMDDNSI